MPQCEVKLFYVEEFLASLSGGINLSHAAFVTLSAACAADWMMQSFLRVP